MGNRGQQRFGRGGQHTLRHHHHTIEVRKCQMAPPSITDLPPHRNGVAPLDRHRNLHRPVETSLAVPGARVGARAAKADELVELKAGRNPIRCYRTGGWRHHEQE
jgi:hypothetical protein